MIAASAPLRVLSSGQVVAAPAAIPMPAPRVPLAYALAGFRTEERGDGSVTLVDPSGHSCGVFASKQLVAGTLAILAR